MAGRSRRHADEAVRRRRSPWSRQQRFDLSGITDDQFFEQAEAKVVDALRSYAEQAQNGQRLQRRLFADDAVRGFAFVDLCHKRFDVVLMNPPFGESSKPAKAIIEKHYPRSKNDIFAAFVECGLNRLRPAGILGAITSRTGFFLSSFQKWREEILLNDATPTVFGDLGSGVLDTAMVETAAYCIEARRSMGRTGFFRLLQADDKAVALHTAIDASYFGSDSKEVFYVNTSAFDRVPGSPFAYWVCMPILKLFKDFPCFDVEARGRAYTVWTRNPMISSFFGFVGKSLKGWFARSWATYFHGGAYVPFLMYCRSLFAGAATAAR